jgi:hypothetical protein
VRHNNVESVGGSALKDHDQTLRANAGIGRAKGGARQETGERGGADYCQRSVAKKNASSDGHKTLLLAVSSWFLANG